MHQDNPANNASGSIHIADATIGHLKIESLDGHIHLEHTPKLQQVELQLTPGTAISLDRIDFSSRMQWQPLSAERCAALRLPPLPEVNPTERPAL